MTNDAATPLRDVKILIPEIPGEWTQRTRSGSTQIWNDSYYKTDLPEVRLTPPRRGLFAELIEGAWYWVCGCQKCLGKPTEYSYIVCEEHDKCDTCNCTRAELTETPWGTSGGWRCKPCQDRMDDARKTAALAAALESGHGEDDCFYTNEIICPYCASVHRDGDQNESASDLECGTCGGYFDLEVEWSASYTTTRCK